MALGPSALGLLREAPLEQLMNLERGALGVIALSAGAELRLSDLHRTGRQVWCRPLEHPCSLQASFLYYDSIAVSCYESSQDMA